MIVAQARCPRCQATVPSAKPIPLGKPINCPRCGVLYHVTPQNLITTAPPAGAPYPGIQPAGRW
jgi:hypothetical protein